MQQNNASGYRGISWYKRYKKWQANIWVDRKQIYLGRFDDIKDAISAYNKASQKYFGEFAFKSILVERIPSEHG